MKREKAAGPIQVGLLRPVGVVARPQLVLHPLQGLLRGRRKSDVCRRHGWRRRGLGLGFDPEFRLRQPGLIYNPVPVLDAAHKDRQGLLGLSDFPVGQWRIGVFQGIHVVSRRHADIRLFVAVFAAVGQKTAQFLAPPLSLLRRKLNLLGCQQPLNPSWWPSRCVFLWSFIHRKPSPWDYENNELFPALEYWVELTLST